MGNLWREWKWRRFRYRLVQFSMRNEARDTLSPVQRRTSERVVKSGGGSASACGTKRAIRWLRRNAAQLGVVSQAAEVQPNARKVKTDGTAPGKWDDGMLVRLPRCRGAVLSGGCGTQTGCILAGMPAFTTIASANNWIQLQPNTSIILLP